MSKDDKKGGKSKQHCGSKKGVMLAFGLTTLGTRVITAFSLAVIALSFCSIKKEAKLFNNCVEEYRNSGKSNSESVRFCNGGSI